MQWEYSGQPLSGFRINEVGKVWLEQRTDYTYTTTLLSSQPTSDNEAKMKSILIVSFANDMNPGNFSVSCNSNWNISTASSQGESPVIIRKGEDIQLEFVVSDNIVSDQYETRIFICGVHQTPHFFQVTGPALAFSRFDDIGQARTIISDDGNTAKVQGILLARDTSLSVTLILVSVGTIVDVTCYDAENTVVWQSVEAVSTDNPTEIAYSSTTEYNQATKLPRKPMEESTNFTNDICMTDQADKGILQELLFGVGMPAIIIPLLLILFIFKLLKYW